MRRTTLLIVSVALLTGCGEEEPADAPEVAVGEYLSALQAKDGDRLCELYSEDYRELIEDESPVPCEESGLGQVDEENELISVDESGDNATAIVSCEDSTASDCSLPLVAEDGEWKVDGSLSPND